MNCRNPADVLSIACLCGSPRPLTTGGMGAETKSHETGDKTGRAVSTIKLPSDTEQLEIVPKSWFQAALAPQDFMVLILTLGFSGGSQISRAVPRNKPPPPFLLFVNCSPGIQCTKTWGKRTMSGRLATAAYLPIRCVPTTR